jgi:hypothetical protein
MALRTDSRLQPSPLVVHDERTLGLAAGWRLDFHVTSAYGDYDATLSIWCDSNEGRVSGAERVARILAPALSEWISTVEQGDKLRVAPPERTRIGRGRKPVPIMAKVSITGEHRSH